MPIYAYQCSQCHFRKDVLQKISDAPLTVCPECGASAFGKQLSAPSFQLKGTGWYATDFKNSGKPASQSASGAASASNDAKSEGGAAAETAASAPAPAAEKASTAPASKAAA
ncbi:zinc ribbon domain-containing protein [Lampropedia puyangensis]|uniref:Zinc ribbon domain-containing protein n=1 Tax=Lampropedia puyangensis TaxID=1330072 RepID=A0A4S8EXS4_9BURK|nr:FmdB family zinc ribbon protein [Lampropedia puyangensis]THT99376.1 zinc ribbon domain-containing protein [Lampropedia puyangensis]